MKKVCFLILTALLCALLLTACGEAVQKDVPSADPSGESPAPSGVSETGDGLSADQESSPVLTPGEDSPFPSETPAESDEPTGAPAEPTGAPAEPTGTPDEPTGAPAEPTGAPAEPTAEPTVPPVPVSSARLGETPDAGREYLDKLIFLGDSTTYGIGYYYNRGFSAELVPPSQIWTPASGTLTLSYYATATIVYPETGEQLFIRDAVERAKPEYLVITLGVNGISFMDEAWFVRDYTALVEMVKAASPETKIILNSIYPVTASYPYQRDINNNKIRAANGWIEQIAVDTGVRFLYSHESIVGADGYLPQDSTNGDGLHLNGRTFAKVMTYIRTHAYR